MTLGDVVVTVARQDVAQQRDATAPRCPRCGGIRLRVRELGTARGITVTCHCRDCGYGGRLEPTPAVLEPPTQADGSAA